MKSEQYPNLPPYPHTYVPAEDEIDLRELLSAFWQGKWIIIFTTVIFAIAAVVFALSKPNIYRADALLSPAQNSNTSGLAAMSGQLGGLASLAGVSLPPQSNQADLAVQVIKSRQFIESFIKKHDILVPLMGSKGWDMGSNQLVLDNELYDIEKNAWLRKPQGLKGAEPTAQEAYRFFVTEVLSVEPDKESGLYRLSVSHYSPYTAQQWVNWLIEDINQVMRERTIRDTTKNLTYLNEQLQKTSVADMQSTFYKLIEDQMKNLMLAEAQEEFVFKVIDPAVVPEEKASPKRALICIAGTLLGCMLGVMIVLVRFVFAKRDSLESE
ncbi:Wzz/FepE/Etk N-terminal domain-containing protein [Vibrio parahaemolyticus]|uniref:Wzz/FepE/Etk N-terminal domain-containing protein n=4 Tax=Vibrio parahaemolyticus TaxID=670 RepID=UPI0004071F05|nr:Wzz/FepE/Etk N-terminal domain-containing protein [Vibrio parahaemolyticus]ANZ08805.1 OtnB protein [Vibrio parahaemolyticus]EGQ7837404.1 LPS O-antigen length regulator [Vibrio parahaemolyticus]EGQ7872564.1 LPS O-antigen length regulator [Vibrio parahaemolyticus]EGQ9248889.1 LPS O-antigen length regulator [Vibrio parahaemolyticus]EGR2288108.1 LPS O-antigen length regulator [Vibrio parahaemolyticus]